MSVYDTMLRLVELLSTGRVTRPSAARDAILPSARARSQAAALNRLSAHLRSAPKSASPPPSSARTAGGQDFSSLFDMMFIYLRTKQNEKKNVGFLEM